MRLLVLIFIISLPLKGLAQIDHQHFRDRSASCRIDHSELIDELRDLKNERDQSMKEYRKGLFCSMCSRSKTQIEKEEKMTFEEHVKSVSGEVISAPPELIEKKWQEYQNRIQRIEQRVDGKRLACERIDMDYKKAVDRENERQRKAALEAQRKQREEAKAKQQAVEEERQREIDEELARQKEAEEERQRAIEAEQARQRALVEAQLERQRQQQAKIDQAQREFDQRTQASAQKTQNRLNAHRANSGLKDDHIADYSSRASRQSGINTDRIESEVFDDSYANRFETGRRVDRQSEVLGGLMSDPYEDLPYEDEGLFGLFGNDNDFLPENGFSALRKATGYFKKKMSDYFESIPSNALSQGLSALVGSQASENFGSIWNIAEKGRAVIESINSFDANKIKAAYDDLNSEIGRSVLKLTPGGNKILKVHEVYSSLTGSQLFKAVNNSKFVRFSKDFLYYSFTGKNLYDCVSCDH